MAEWIWIYALGIALTEPRTGTRRR